MKRRQSPHLDRLNRAIRLHGESLELIRTTGAATQTRNRVNLRGIVKTLGFEQLFAGVSQINNLVLVSPTDLRRTGWPGGRGPATVLVGTLPDGHHPPKDFTLPTTADKIAIRGGERAISLVTAIYDGDDCVRIELKVLG